MFGMSIKERVVGLLLLTWTFVPPVVAAAALAWRGRHNALERRKPRALPVLFRALCLVCAIVLGVLAAYAAQQAFSLQFFTGWSLAHGSFIFLWPIMFGVTFGTCWIIERMA